MKTKGLLVALEGIDNSGKTSHVTKLAEFYQRRGREVVTTKELTSPIGTFIREDLYAKKLTAFLKTYLFATDRATRYERIVLPALQNGCLVLADRWNVSAYVYRGLEGYDVEFVRAVNSKIPQPDLTIILDLSVKLSLKCGEEANRPCPYTAKQLEQARKLYGEYAQATRLPVVDAVQSFDVIFEQLRNLIDIKLRGQLL